MSIIFTRSSNIYDDSRATKEITAFLKAGYSVTVLGWNRNGDAEEQCNQVFHDYINEVKFYFYNGDQGNNLISKLFSRYKWNCWINQTLQYMNDIDFIHACDFDTGKEIRKFALKRKIKYIYDIYDYYVDAHKVPLLLKSYIENQEIKVINDSELCIICTEERKEQIQKASPKKVLVLYNSPDVDAPQDTVEQYDYSYCGSMYDGRLLGETLDMYQENSDYIFVFAGYGKYSEKAKFLSERMKNFTYLGAIPYSQVLEVETKSRVISAIYDPSLRNHRLCAPNKFYEAMALGKPIIVCEGTGIDQIVKDNNIGVVIPYSAEQFYDALKYLIDNEDICRQMGRKARILYENKYSWSIMEQKLIDSLRLV